MRSTKGLSPVVATIILIAFAVAIGGLVAIWLTGFATDTTEFTSEKGHKFTECSGALIKIDSVTDGGIIFSNQFGKTIQNITAYDSAGRNLTVNTTTLVPGQVSNITWSSGSNSSIFMRVFCLDTVIVEGRCQAGQSCWE